LALAGCANTYKQEGVPSIPAVDVAVIEDDPCKDNKCLTIKKIDGRERGIGLFKRYELLPGLRRIQLNYSAGYSYSSAEMILEFTAESGHVYKMSANADRWQWRPEIIDQADQRVVSRMVGYVGEWRQVFDANGQPVLDENGKPVHDW
jgi:hypothetical protein